MIANAYRVSFGDDENVLKLDSRDQYAILRIYNKTLNQIVYFIVCDLYVNKLLFLKTTSAMIPFL